MQLTVNKIRYRLVSAQGFLDDSGRVRNHPRVEIVMKRIGSPQSRPIRFCIKFQRDKEVGPYTDPNQISIKTKQYWSASYLYNEGPLWFEPKGHKSPTSKRIDQIISKFLNRIGSLVGKPDPFQDQFVALVRVLRRYIPVPILYWADTAWVPYREIIF
jgi:hypothetical protein